MMGLGMLIVLPAMILVTVVLLAMPVLMAVWIGRGLGLTRGSQVAPVVGVSSVCPNCHQGVTAGWRNCPHCGQSLA